MNEVVKYIPYFEYVKMWKDIQASRRYVSYTHAEDCTLPTEIKVYEQSGLVIYRPRALTKLEKILK